MSEIKSPVNGRGDLSVCSKSMMLICRLAVILYVVLIGLDVKLAIATLISKDQHFATFMRDGLTATEAIVSCIAFPVITYIAWFLFWGRAGIQTRLALAIVVTSWVFVLAFVIYSLQPSLPGGYVNMELVVSAIIALVFQSSLTIGVFLKYRRNLPVHKPIAHPLCSACGYDSTGNTSGICPECGTPLDAEKG